MAKAVDGERAADPDRLAVFAVRSLVSMLDPNDEVSLVRLNGPRSGHAPPPIEPLARNAPQILGLLTVTSPLAAYDGKVTPCRSALDATAALLEEAYRPNVAQVVIFLTDGACTPQAEETPDAQSFLGRLRAHRDGLFQLYLLRFRGRQYTPALARIAEATGGQAIEVSGADPTEILEPFADALTRSQGYEAEVLTPREREIAAHRGAKRVRLLAVAEGEGSPLGFVVADRRGHQPQLLGHVVSDRHRYGSGRVFRYAAVDYRPGTEPVTVDVTGGGAGWKVVAVPEYRLFARLALHEGDCDEPGPELHGSAETGSSVCAVVTLEDEKGEVVDAGSAGGGVEASIRFHRADDAAARAVPMNRAGEAARFTYPYRNLPRERYVVEPVLQLRLAGRDQSVTLPTPPQSLQVTSFEVTPQPATVDFGALRPGDRPPGQSIVFRGNFPPTPGRLEVADRAEIPSCVTFSLAGEEEGKPVAILEGQIYSLEVRVDPYCGPHSLPGRLIDTPLRLVFDTAPGGHRLPTVTMPSRMTLDYAIEVPTDITVELKAGQGAAAAIEVRGNQSRPLVLRAVLPPVDGRRGWPKHLDLTLDPADRNGDGGRHAVADTLTYDPARGAPGRLDLRFDSDACCEAGRYTSQLGLVPAGGTWSGERPPPLIVPLTAVVAGRGLWACYGGRLLWLLALLALVLVVLYLVNMVRNSRWLPRDGLGEVLVPLRWGGMGAAEPVNKARPEVRDLVRRSLTFRDRAAVWFRSNPLKFGLPGGAYNETVELLLVPNTQVSRSQVRLVPGRGFLEHVQSNPEQYVGRLFARAETGTITVFTVPRGTRVGRLESERLTAIGADPNAKPKLVRLRRERLLDPTDHREPGRAAGWQINRPRMT